MYIQSNLVQFYDNEIFCKNICVVVAAAASLLNKKYE